MFNKIKDFFINKHNERKHNKDVKKIKKELFRANWQLITIILELIDRVHYWSKAEINDFKQQKVNILKEYKLKSPKKALESVLAQNLIIEVTTQIEEFDDRYNKLNKILYFICKKLTQLDDDIIYDVCFEDVDTYDEFLGLCLHYALQVSQFRALIDDAKDLGIDTKEI